MTSGWPCLLKTYPVSPNLVFCFLPNFSFLGIQVNSQTWQFLLCLSSQSLTMTYLNMSLGPLFYLKLPLPSHRPSRKVPCFLSQGISTCCSLYLGYPHCTLYDFSLWSFKKNLLNVHCARSFLFAPLDLFSTLLHPSLCQETCMGCTNGLPSHGTLLRISQEKRQQEVKWLINPGFLLPESPWTGCVPSIKSHISYWASISYSHDHSLRFPGTNHAHCLFKSRMVTGPHSWLVPGCITILCWFP